MKSLPLFGSNAEFKNSVNLDARPTRLSIIGPNVTLPTLSDKDVNPTTKELICEEIVVFSCAFFEKASFVAFAAAAAAAEKIEVSEDKSFNVALTVFI